MKYIKACECGQWHLEVWNPGDELNRRRVPYKCRSWRHAGDCRLWKGAQDFVRCKEAIESRDNWTFCVLTFDQSAWDNPIDQYKHGFKLWSKLRLRLRRKYGTIAYIQTWERHKKGGAHVNLVMSNDDIHQAVTIDRKAWERSVLKPNAVACGFGHRVWAEPLREGTGEGMAGYLVKLARELTGAEGKDQTPIDAPRHFRRLRASAGLLPPPIKSGMTGRMVFHAITDFVLATDATFAAKRGVQEESRRLAGESGGPLTTPAASQRPYPAADPARRLRDRIPTRRRPGRAPAAIERSS